MSRSGYTCVRVVFCSVNLLFWVAGCALVGGAVWLQVAPLKAPLPQRALLYAGALVGAAGALVFLLATCACCGALVQSRCLLITYFCLVAAVFAAEFGAAALAFAYGDRLDRAVRQELREALAHHYNASYTEEDGALATLWDDLQTSFRCCGVDGYEDWFLADEWAGEGRRVPDSCCLPASAGAGCGAAAAARDALYPVGCYARVRDWLAHRLHVVGLLALLVAFLQMFGLISSMMLFCTVKYRRRSRTYKSYS